MNMAHGHLAFVSQDREVSLLGPLKGGTIVHEPPASIAISPHSIMAAR